MASRSTSPRPTGASRLRVRNDGNKDAQFLHGITPQSRQEDFKRMVKLLSQANPTTPEVMKAGIEASKRYCQDARGFERFVKNGGLEALAMIQPRIEEAAQEGSQSQDAAMIRRVVGALGSLEDAACSWLARVDHIESQDMPAAVLVSKWLGPVSKLVAFHALKTLERFVLHRRANCKALLDQGSLVVLHRILGAHRSPEVVLEALVLLFRLTDPPGRQSVKYIVEEQELVTTVVQWLKDSDSDMRIQLAGLRLLSLWSQWQDAALQEVLARSRASDELDRAIKDLSKTGVPHMAMWLRTVAMRSLPRSSEAAALPA